MSGAPVVVRRPIRPRPRPRSSARPRGSAASPGCPATSRSATGRCSSRRWPRVTSRIDDAGDGDDVRTTARLIERLGASVERLAGDGRRVSYRVVSPGVDGLQEADGVIDCGNSGTTLRLAAGILAGLDATHVLDGDSSLRRRPVARIIEPLRSMGAVLHARRNDFLPPLTVVGHTPLRAIDHSTIVPSAQVKSAILLAGAARRRPHDGPRGGRDPRPHRADAPGAWGTGGPRGDRGRGRSGLECRGRGTRGRGRRAGPSGRVRGRVLAGRRRDPPGRRADAARGRREPDPAGDPRAARSDGRPDRRGRARRRATTGSASRWPT